MEILKRQVQKSALWRRKGNFANLAIIEAHFCFAIGMLAMELTMLLSSAQLLQESGVQEDGVSLEEMQKVFLTLSESS